MLTPQVTGSGEVKRNTEQPNKIKHQSTGVE